MEQGREKKNCEGRRGKESIRYSVGVVGSQLIKQWREKDAKGDEFALHVDGAGTGQTLRHLSSR